MSFDVTVPRELFVVAVDLYILLGNTLDKTIEACSTLPVSERRISVKLKTHNNILFYKLAVRHHTLGSDGMGVYGAICYSPQFGSGFFDDSEADDAVARVNT